MESCLNDCLQNMCVISFIGAKLKVQKKALDLFKGVSLFQNLHNKQKKRYLVN